MKTQQKSTNSLNTEQTQIFCGLIGIIIIVFVVVILVLELQSGDEIGDAPPEPIIPARLTPSPDILQLPLNTNFTNLISNTNVELHGTFQHLGCIPSFEPTVLPDLSIGTSYFHGCPEDDLYLDTGIIYPAIFTITAWVNPQTSTLMNVLSATNNSGLQPFIQMSSNSTKAGLLNGDSIMIDPIEANGFDNTWFFVALTVDHNGLFTLYVDNQMNSISIPAWSGNSLRPMIILGGPLACFQGMLYSIQFWSIALNSSQINEIQEDGLNLNKQF